MSRGKRRSVRSRLKGAVVVAVALVALGALGTAAETGSANALRLDPVVPTIPTVAPATTTGAPSTTPVEAPPSTVPTDQIPPVPEAPATALVGGLAVSDGDPRAGEYRRKAFGDGWDYDPPSGCNTRELVLIAESRTPPTMGERCRPLAGHWVSVYDGLVTDDPGALEIDHLVPLSNAWRSGAASWTDERREAFANDLDDDATLVAVSSRSNRSKGDSTPDRWLPSDPGARCDYVEWWVRVKARWELTVSPAEKASLVQVLGGC